LLTCYLDHAVTRAVDEAAVATAPAAIYRAAGVSFAKAACLMQITPSPCGVD